MKGLALKVPPALLMLICGLMMVGIDRLFPMFKQSWSWHNWVYNSLFLLAAALILAGIISFRLARTTVDPTHPEKATAVVTTGIYQFTRNPMYLGFLLILMALGFKLANPVTWVILPCFLWYMNHYQIKPEERALTELFGAEYEAYLQQVRRWL